MSERTQMETPKLQAWLSEWPAVRAEVEGLLQQYVEQDPTMHFEITLAQLELKDLDEAAQRVSALGKLLRGGDLSSAEMQATGNT
jgi:hypothetical protein